MGPTLSDWIPEGSWHALTWIRMGSDVDSILDAVLTVSPNTQYRGILSPA